MTRQKLLQIRLTAGQENSFAARQFGPDLEIETVHSPTEAIAKLARYSYSGVYLDGQSLEQEESIIRLLQSERILDGLPEGVALVNAEMEVTWANKGLRSWSPLPDPTGHKFYDTLGNTQIVGPDFCPFHTALATGSSSYSTLQTDDNRYFSVHVSPLTEAATDQAALVATVSEITAEIMQQQKLAAIHQAGRQLTDLKPDEIFAMDTQARIDLLKDNIRHYTADLLNVEVVEIRLLEANGNLMPLLSVGIDQEAADRQLFASPHSNGVTGFVASTGKSYLCEDASQDPLYLEAFEGAASSLTVPLLLHDTIIGTINVESNKVRAFDAADLQFLEIFARDVAAALNTLELLVAQKNNAAQQSCEAIHSAVALPVDYILNDAVAVIEKYLGHDPDVVKRLHRILQNARDIRRVIQQIGQRLAPGEAAPAGCSQQLHQKLRSKRILVVDAEEQILREAHALLERYGCVVETAHCGDEAVSMYRASHIDAAYDVVISAIRLPDYSGYQLMLRLQKITEIVPLALMTGFGYDPGHSIVNARKAGLHPKALLYKPFRVTQLINVVETVIDAYHTEAV
ncbi:MAG: GAF domain-containing protein [Planctomycetales bacterium]|nr:GAF domain-containing protein [Planctomycetales bacterium]